MGNRALIQVVGDYKQKDIMNEEVSPVLYLHWANHIDKILLTLHNQMRGRVGDVNYSFARLVEIACCMLDSGGCMSIEVWNQTKRLVNDDSHGDEGCIIYHCDTGKIERFGICDDISYDEEEDKYIKTYRPMRKYNVSEIVLEG